MASADLIKAVNGYENYILENGVTDEVVDAYIMAANTAFLDEHDDEAGRRISKRCRSLIAKQIYEGTQGADPWWLEKQAFIRNESYTLLDKFNQVLLLEGQNRVLDSYLRYLEHKRLPQDRFYMPKRPQFLKIGLVQALQDMLDDKADILCISLPPGTGKAQPLYSKVLTPDGFVSMGDICVGDKVISGAGNISTVIGVYPQGIKPIYELTFDDGSKCRCSDEHLWKVQTRDDRNKKHFPNGRYRTIMLKDMIGRVRVENGKRLNYSIDYVAPIDFAEKQFAIQPYVMGALLGNGGFTSGGIIFSSVDSETIQKVDDLLPDGYSLKHRDRCSYSVRGHRITGDGGCENEVVTAIKEYGLYGHKSADKFVPEQYKTASYAQRLELIRGLMDTDGYAQERGAQYCSVSKQLAEDVAELIHSIGGYASITKKDAGYKKNGEYIPCQAAYTVHICMPKNAPSVFSLKRKKDKFKPKREVIKRFVEDIRFVGNEECQCIMIDDPCHLYITDDYIITHNTTIEKFFLSGVIGWFPKDYNLFFSHSGDIARMFYDGEYDIVSNAEEYAWNEIFPDLKVTATNAKMQTFNVGAYKPFQSLQCTSRGSNNAGVVRASKFLMVDDLIAGIEEALNKNILDKLWDIYAVDARQRKIDKCKEIIIATRWSVNDVIGRLQLMYPDNNRVRFIAVPDIDPDTGKSNFDYEYNGFSVAFFRDQELLMDDISYRCLYKQEPIEREGLLYHEDELRRYVMLPEKEPDAILGICDTKAKGSDFMFLPCCYQYGDNYYCVDCICDDSSDFGTQETRCANLILDRNMQQCQFESNTGGDRFAANVAQKVAEAGGRCNITTKPTETNKETKIIVNADWVKKHVLFPDKTLIQPKSDMDRMLKFLLTYAVTGKNSHDDIPDGWAMFALFVTGGKRTATVEAVWNPFRGMR